ncbi:MAG: YceD family protein [Chloroflexota bacterium]
MINQAIGYSRDFPFDIPEIHLPPDFDLSNLTGVARFTRTPQGLLAQIKMQADVELECVRCLLPYVHSLAVDFSELYAFSKKTVSETGLLLPENGYISLEPLLREYMLLELPIKPLCRPDCKGLCPVCGGNLNEQVCQHDDQPIDERLAVLKSLKKDQEDL